jgi:RimJ/RimL family protein N-acetyltransferase
VIGTVSEIDVRIRPVRLSEDLQHALRWYADPEVLRDSEGTDEPYDLEVVTRMYEYFIDLGELYVIEVSDDGDWVAIGDAALCQDTIPIVIGDPAYRSRGLGRIELGLLVERGRELEWAQLRVGKVFAHNERSLRLYGGAGFVPVSEFTDDNGQPCVSMVLTL